MLMPSMSMDCLATQDARIVRADDACCSFPMIDVQRRLKIASLRDKDAARLASGDLFSIGNASEALPAFTGCDGLPRPRRFDAVMVPRA